jgi:hypothetical protein
MGTRDQEQERALSRRTALAIVGAAGVELMISGEARAAEPPPRAPGQVIVGLAAVALGFFWEKVLSDDQRQAIRDSVGQAAVDVGRKVASIVENTISTVSGPRAAPITIRIRKHPAGHLLIDARLEDMDGDGKPEMTHSGTAPHAHHPDMQAHAKQIVGKAHAWLRAHKM